MIEPAPTPPRHAGLALGCLVLLLGASGCGSQKSELAGRLVPARGQVSLDGKPLGGAQITFVPDFTGGERAVALSDDDGRFDLSTVPSGQSASDKPLAGAVPGPYRVSILKFQTRDGGPVPPDKPPMEVGAVNVLPEHYARGDALKVTVGEQGEDISLALRSRR